MTTLSTKGDLTYSEKFAKFVGDCRFESLSASEVTNIKERILDQIGCQLIASTLPTNLIVYDYIREYGAPGPCTVVGTDTRLSVLDAAFVNATFGQGCEFDDFGHGGAASVPGAFALAEHRGATGRDLITAVAIGYEIFFRLFETLVPELVDRGFHPQCTIGVFASAALSAKFLGLTEEQLVQAFGIAGSHSSGMVAHDRIGGLVKRMHAGLGARGGIQAALLAQKGLTAPRSIFESTRGGIFHTFVQAARVEYCDKDLGSKFLFPKLVATKFWPTVGAIHTSIDAFGKMVDQHHFTADEVKSVKVGVEAFAINHGGTVVVPTDEVSAQFSVGFSLALRLIHGHNDLTFYLDPKMWADPAILEFSRKVQAYVDPAAVGEYRYSGRVTVELKSGATLEGYQPFRKGAPGNQATPEEFQQRYRSLAGHVFDNSRMDAIAGMVDRLDSMEDATPLIALLRNQSIKD